MEQNTNGVGGGGLASLLPVGRLLSDTFSFYKTHFSLIFSITAVPVVLGVLQVLLQKGNAGLSALFGILTFLVAVFARLALLKVLSEGGHNLKSSYAGGLTMFWPFVWMGAFAALASIGGMMLLVIPGIVVSILLSVSTYVLFVEGKKGFDALIQSWHYVRGHWWGVFGRYVALGLIFMVIGLALMLFAGGPMFGQVMQGGSLTPPEIPVWYSLVNLFFSYVLALPLGLIYSFNIYQSLRQVNVVPATEEEKAKTKKHIMVFMIVGAVGLVLTIVFSGFSIFQSLSDIGGR